MRIRNHPNFFLSFFFFFLEKNGSPKLIIIGSLLDNEGGVQISVCIFHYKSRWLLEKWCVYKQVLIRPKTKSPHSQSGVLIIDNYIKWLKKETKYCLQYQYQFSTIKRAVNILSVLIDANNWRNTCNICD